MEETSKIMPKWMEIKHKIAKKDDDFKCIITYGSPRFPMINVKGFFLYLQYRQSKMYK